MLIRTLGVIATVTAALVPPAAQSDVLAITGVTVIDVAAPRATDALKTDQTVVVAGDRIADVGATGRTRVPPGAHRIDGRGKFLIPGSGTCTCT